MPTNVTPEYRKAEERFRAAQTTDEKIVRLQEMIALLPKHKGTEHLHADLKRRLSQLKEQYDRTPKIGGSHAQHIEKSGAAQIVVIGAPNSGKSSLVAALTDAPVEIADYPFTTNQMQPGMMDSREVQVQLIDTPPVTEDYMPPQLFGLIRSADAAVITVDLSTDDLVDDYRAVRDAFTGRGIRFVAARSTDHDAVLTHLVGTKADVEDSDVRLALFREAEGADLPLMPVTVKEADGESRLAELIINWLGIIRVYTKSPHEREPKGRPFALFRNHTVDDLCRKIHRDLADRFEYARMWRQKDPPITVSRSQVLEDGDIIEIHAQG